MLHGKYEVGRLLGHGTFAKVYHARNLQTEKSVAMKVVGKDKVIKVGMTKQVKREISVMKMVQHPNIVELQEVKAHKILRPISLSRRKNSYFSLSRVCVRVWVWIQYQISDLGHLIFTPKLQLAMRRLLLMNTFSMDTGRLLWTWGKILE